MKIISSFCSVTWHSVFSDRYRFIQIEDYLACILYLKFCFIMSVPPCFNMMSVMTSGEWSNRSILSQLLVHATNFTTCLSWIQSQSSTCGMYGGQNDSGTGFLSQVMQLFSVTVIPPVHHLNISFICGGCCVIVAADSVIRYSTSSLA
jgi:hypothetical protein